MTDTPDPHPPPPAAAAFDRALGRARWALLWEQAWPAAAGFATAAGLFVAASWAELWAVLPPPARPFALFVFLALAAYAGAPLVRLHRPGRRALLRRLDRASGQPHRPASALDDELGTKRADAVSRALWEAHRARMLAATRNLAIGLPSPRLVERDPYALRALVLLLLVATWFMAEGERGKRVLLAFDWTGPAAPAPYRIDAWVTPPAYTARPPLLLSGMRPGEAVAPGRPAGPIEVPAGSVVTVRATGLGDLALQTRGGLKELAAADGSAPPAGTIERRLEIVGGGQLSLHEVGEADLVWSFSAVPDRPPTIAMTRPPTVVGRGALSLGYRLEDDYGVAAAEARLELKDRPAGARPLYTLPPFALSLPQARTRSGAAETVKDLTDHPFAGAMARLTLAARDDAGNEGVSDTAELMLPQRSFNDPLARALVEQRRLLALDAGRHLQVERALDALALAPERFTPDPRVYLGLRSAYWRLANARDDDDLRGVADYLWQIAVQLEDGTMADAERELRAAEEALRQALERGAGDDELKQLTDNLRQALDRFLRELAEEMRRNPGRHAQARPDSATRILRPQDLQAMIDRLENLARSGSRDAAQRMLEELQAMLDSLDRSRSGDMAGDEGERDAIDQLGDMIRNQQQLRDRTWREGREQRDRQRRGQGNPDHANRDHANPGASFGDLQRNQEELRRKLEGMLDQLSRLRRDQNEGTGEGEEDQAFGRARDAMREAERQLGSGNADGAVGAQGKAIDNLRRGAQNLAQNQQNNGRGNPNGPGQTGDADTDPLGRPRTAGRDLDSPSRDFVPDAVDAQRARRVLEELRRRLGEGDRPRLELDYLERLLKGF